MSQHCAGFLCWYSFAATTSEDPMGCEGCTKLLRETSYDIKLFSQTFSNWYASEKIIASFYAMLLETSNPRNPDKTSFCLFPWERTVKTERDDTLAWRVACLGSLFWICFSPPEMWDFVSMAKHPRTHTQESQHTERSCRLNCVPNAHCMGIRRKSKIDSRSTCVLDLCWLDFTILYRILERLKILKQKAMAAMASPRLQVRHERANGNSGAAGYQNGSRPELAGAKGTKWVDLKRDQTWTLIPEYKAKMWWYNIYILMFIYSYMHRYIIWIYGIHAFKHATCRMVGWHGKWATVGCSRHSHSCIFMFHWV